MSTLSLTPARLDLKVKDRVPGYFPKEGDAVRIKNRGWYEKWKDKDTGLVTINDCNFSKDMAYFCGGLAVITSVKRSNDRIFYLNTDFNQHCWIPEFFEEVFPVNEVLEVTAAPSIDTKPADVSYQSSYCGSILSGSITADDCRPISLLSGYGGMTAEEAVKAITIKDPPVIHFTNNFGTEEPPQLNTIKRKRFVKIKNL